MVLICPASSKLTGNGAVARNVGFWQRHIFYNTTSHHLRKGFENFTGRPHPMKQYRQLPGHRNHRPFLADTIGALGKTPSPEGRIFAPMPEHVMGALHQLAKHASPLLGNTQLRIAFAGLFLPRAQRQNCPHLAVAKSFPTPKGRHTNAAAVNVPTWMLASRSTAGALPRLGDALIVVANLRRPTRRSLPVIHSSPFAIFRQPARRAPKVCV